MEEIKKPAPAVTESSSATTSSSEKSADSPPLSVITFDDNSVNFLIIFSISLIRSSIPQ